MALAGSRKANLGDAVTRTAATGSATVDIRFPLCNSDFNRALKLSLGRLRISAARRTKGSISAAALLILPSLRAIMASTAWFSCSIFFWSVLLGPPLPGRERLGIGTLHARPQRRQGAEL